MLAILEAQHRARQDPDALIRAYIANTMKANIISAEMADRKLPYNARQAIARSITKEITADDLDDDWDNLIDGKARGGLRIVDYFTRLERLATKGKKGVSFYDFLEDPKLRPSQDAFLKKLEIEQPNSNETQRMWLLYKYEHSSISAFPPSQMTNALEKYNINVILDPCMGWGGRLLGACALGAKQYIGIDSNTDLVLPYHNLKTFIERKNGANTYISLMFRDCLSIDYSTLNYDCVFTSPPYYTRETYPHQPELWRSKAEWNELFYKPLITKTWNGLKEQGIYAINVSPEIYQYVITILGQAHEIVPLKKSDCFRANDNYKEFVYIWVKPVAIEFRDLGVDLAELNSLDSIV